MLTSENINRVFLTDISRRQFAQSFLNLTSVLDLTTSPSQRATQPHCDTMNAMFHHHFKELNKKLTIDKFQDGQQHDAFLFIQRLWNLLDQVFPSHAYLGKSRLRCKQCNVEKYSYQDEPSNFMSLAVVAPEGMTEGEMTPDENCRIVSLNELLAQDLGGYGMADVNSMCCNCKDQKPHTRCSHEVHFTDEGPRYLYVHLKRYTRYSKLFTRVTCPENNGEVQIYDEHTKKNLRFRIESIVVHAGKDSNSGHYYSVGRNGTFNDKKVKFDEGKSFNTLLLDGVLRATEGFEDQRYDAYGYMYFLVEVPLTENISSSSSSSSSSSTSSSYSSPSSSSFSSST